MAQRLPNGIDYDQGTGQHDAMLDLHHAWRDYIGARTLLDQATALEELSNYFAAFETWLPGYDYQTGEVDDPRFDKED